MTACDDLLAAVRLYQFLGFFEQFPGTTEDELASLLRVMYFERSGGTRDLCALPPEALDVPLLSLDASRHCWFRMGAHVGPGSQTYAGLLAAWAAISRGTFQPRDVQETWASEAGPVTLTFTLAGAPHHYRLALDERVDRGLLVLVNGLIASTNVQLVPLLTGDASVFVIALTAAEKACVKAARPWHFGATT